MKEKILKWLLVSLTLFNYVFTTPIFATEENGSICDYDENGFCPYGYYNGEQKNIYFINPDIDFNYTVDGFTVTNQYYFTSGSQVSFGSSYYTTLGNLDVDKVRAFVSFPEIPTNEGYYDITLTFETVGFETAMVDYQLYHSGVLLGYGVNSPQMNNGSYEDIINGSTVTVKFDDVQFGTLQSITHIGFLFYISPSQLDIQLKPTSIVFKDVTEDVLAGREEEERNGLLATIIGWIEDIYQAIIELPINIYNSLTGLFQKVVNAVTSIGDLIVNAINKIQQWLKDLLNGILEGLKSLFIPSNEYFKNYFDELYAFFTEKLGILMLPIDIMIQVFNGIMNIENGDGFIHVPEVKYMDCVLIPKTDYDVQSAINEVMGPTYELYYLFVDVILIVMVLNMARVKFDEIVGGKK